MIKTWQRLRKFKDEIGDLIKTYNEMVLEVNENRKAHDLITFASLIQNSYLPVSKTSKLESHVIWKPRDVVSGDIFFGRNERTYLHLWL